MVVFGFKTVLLPPAAFSVLHSAFYAHYSSTTSLGLRFHRKIRATEDYFEGGMPHDRKY